MNKKIISEILGDSVYQVKSPLVSEESFLLEQQGDNDLLVLLDSELTSDLREFLSKILSAVHYDITNTTLTNVNDLPNKRFTYLEQNIRFKKVICFGISPEAINLNINSIKYRPLAIGDKTLLFSESLFKVQEDKEKKAKLWNALQALFMVKKEM